MENIGQQHVLLKENGHFHQDRPPMARPRGILCVDKIGSPENPQQPVAANVGANGGANP